MFERLTETAIKSILCAQEESSALGHNYVGTEMFLLGLLKVESDMALVGNMRGPAEAALAGAHLDLAGVRADVEAIIGRGPGRVKVEVPFTDRAKRVLENSWNEAKLQEVNFIGTEHILLGLLRETEICKSAGTDIGVAARVLEARDIDLSKLRQSVIELIKIAGETAT